MKQLSKMFVIFIKEMDNDGNILPEILAQDLRRRTNILEGARIADISNITAQQYYPKKEISFQEFEDMTAIILESLSIRQTENMTLEQIDAMNYSKENRDPLYKD